MMPKRCISDEVSFLDKNARNVIIDNISETYWPHIRAKGHHLVVKPYIRPTKAGEVMLPEALRAEDQHHSVAAQVIDVGPTAYTNETYCGGLAWTEVGDWVFIPRVAGARVAMKDSEGNDTMLRIVKEDDIIAVINDPSEWEIRINATKY